MVINVDTVTQIQILCPFADSLIIVLMAINADLDILIFIQTLK